MATEITPEEQEQNKDKLKRIKTLEKLPNTINGDGRNFIIPLKEMLKEGGFGGGSGGGGEGGGGGDKPDPNPVEQLVDLRLSELHESDGMGTPVNIIQVDFNPVNVKDYHHTQIWYKTGQQEFQRYGDTTGNRGRIEGVKSGNTYVVKVVAVNSKGKAADFLAAPSKSIFIQGSSIIPGAPSQLVLTWDIDGPLWQWLYEDNGYLDYFELRLDDKPGTFTDKLLDRTDKHWSRADPGVRSGTAYLYVRNTFGTYGPPAILHFTKPAPGKPNPPIVEPTLDGVVITMDPLPAGLLGYKLIINGEKFTSYNRQFTYFLFMGEVTVKYCFFDSLGEGEYSDIVTKTITGILDPDDLPPISYDDFDQAIKDAIDKANLQDAINQDLNAALGGLRTDLGTLDNDLKDLGEDIKGINGNLDGLGGDITDINGNLQNIIDNLNKLPENSPYLSIIKTKESITSIAGEISRVEGNTVANATEIQQTKDNITLLAGRVKTTEDGVKTNASQIKINADAIVGVVESVKTVDGKTETNATSIKQTSADITLLSGRVKTTEDGVKTNASQIKINADAIVGVVESVKIVDGKAETNATSIKQTSADITLLSGRVKKTEDDIVTNAASIKVNTDKIGLLVADVKTANDNIAINAGKLEVNSKKIEGLVADIKTVDDKTVTNAGLIKVNSDKIGLMVTDISNIDGKAKANATQIKLESGRISSVVNDLRGNYVDSQFQAITGLGSSIQQTKNSITGVVTELNKEKPNYAGFTVLQEGIDLSVRKDEIISRINLSPEVITIDGKWLHVTGNTVFDKGVIAEDLIATNAVTSDKIKANSVTTAKIAANAITADKIQAGAITNEKITDKSIQSVKIADGAITVTKIAKDAVTSEGLADNAVTTTKIVGGAITTDKIMANAINAQHLSADSVTSRSMTAGCVTAEKIGAGAVDASKINVESLSAITAVIGLLRTAETGARMEISSNLIQIFDENNRLRVRMGVW